MKLYMDVMKIVITTKSGDFAEQTKKPPGKGGSLLFVF